MQYYKKRLALGNKKTAYAMVISRFAFSILA